MSQEYDSLYLAVEATADAMTVRTYSVSAEGAQSLLDTYTMRVPASVCRDKGHDFSGDTVYVRDGKLVCSFCGQTVELKDSGYTGWARDEATGLRMYSYNNAWHTGWFIIDPEVYCFDSNGIAYDGRVTLYGKQFVFDGRRGGQRPHGLRQAGRRQDPVLREWPHRLRLEGHRRRHLLLRDLRPGR